MPAAAYPLLSALLWATAVILFKQSGDHRMSAVGLNLLKGLVGLSLFLATTLVTGTQLFGPSWRDILLIAASGVAGIGIADSLYFYCLTTLGAGRTAIISTAYAPMIAFFSFVLLGEELSPLDAVGGVAIVLAIPLATTPGRSADANKPASDRPPLRGIAAALLSMALMTSSIVAVKPLLSDAPVLVSTFWRLAGGIVALIIWSLMRQQRRAQVLRDLQPQPAWRFALPGSVIGTYFALLLWMSAFKYNDANIAGMLTQTASVFTVLLATIVLREAMTRRKALALALGFVGSILVLL